MRSAPSPPAPRETQLLCSGQDPSSGSSSHAPGDPGKPLLSEHSFRPVDRVKGLAYQVLICMSLTFSPVTQEPCSHTGGL